MAEPGRTGAGRKPCTAVWLGITRGPSGRQSVSRPRSGGCPSNGTSARASSRAGAPGPGAQRGRQVNSPNRDTLLRVARGLGPLLEELVFVGGQVAELLITDPGATRVRPTDDVDTICAVHGRVGYHRLSERLRGLGFVEDTSPGAPV